MPWFKVDDQLYSHPKWLATPLPARGLWASAGSWCAAQVTDGLVPTAVLVVLGGRRKDALDLVASGLWDADPAGWRFHDWDKFQPSAEQVNAERDAARQRQKRAREKARLARQESQDGHAVTHAPVTPGVTVPPTRPDPTRPNGSSSSGFTRSPDRRRDEKHQLPPNSAPEGIADLEHHDVPLIPEDVQAQNLAAVKALKSELHPLHIVDDIA